VGVKPPLRGGPGSLTSRVETAVASIRRPRLPYWLPKRRINCVRVNPSQEPRDCEPRITRWAVAVPTAYASCGDFELARQLKIGYLQAASCQANQICHGSHMSGIGAMSAAPVALSRLPPLGLEETRDDQIPVPNCAVAFVGTFEQKTIYMAIELCLSINS
jgi:hypothetical protein